MERNLFREHLRRVILIGLAGGIVLALYDAIVTIWRGDTRLFNFGDLVRLAGMATLVYIILGIVLMLVIGTVFWLLYRANRLPDSPLAHSIFQIGLFFAGAGFYVLTDLLNVRGATKPLSSLWEALFLSLFVGVGIAAFYGLVQRAVRKRPLRVLALASPIIILMVLAGFDMVRSHQLPQAFFTFSHNPHKIGKGVQTSDATAQQKPNILWIVLDTTRADHLSPYGYQRDTTPNIAALAKEGTTYADDISVAPWTFPSHAAMLTGMFPSKNGADGQWPWLGNEFTTLPELLQQNGYQTLGYSNNDNFAPVTNLNQGFDVFNLFTRPEALDKNLLLARSLRSFLVTVNAKGNFLGLGSLYTLLTDADPRKDFGAEQTIQTAKRDIDGALSAKQPFFSFINLMEAHDPYGDSPDGGMYLHELKNAPTLDQARVRENRLSDDVHAYVARKATLSDEDKAIITALYDGDVHYLDREVGDLLNRLRERGILDSTMVIITADHGENLGDHGLIDHVYDIHRNLTRIPLIIRYPAKFNANTTSNALVQNIDLFPTVLDITGVQADRKELQGISLLGPVKHDTAVSEAVFVNDTFQRTRYILPLFPGVDQRYFGGMWKSVQDGTYEYIETPRGVEVYNIVNDPGEEKNLADTQPDVRNRLQKALSAWRKSFVHYWDPYSQE